MATHVLLAGFSTRAAAASAASTGYRVTSIDAFADADQHPDVRAWSMPRDFGTAFTPSSAAAASRTVDCDAVAYLSSFENDPDAVATLSAGRRLWGNPPEVLRRVRDPFELARICRGLGFATPRLARASNGPRDSNALNAPNGSNVSWLVKPFASGGGQDVRPWHAGARSGPDTYLQEFVGGIPGSVTFVASDGRARPLGVSRQLAGEEDFGTSGFRYCGNLLNSRLITSHDLVTRLTALVEGVAGAFGLTGVGCIDVILAPQGPVPIEVNPRWSASMELVERAFGLSVFGAHADACRDAALTTFDLSDVRRSPVFGKAVVFAREDVMVTAAEGWRAGESIADVPRAGESIAAGQPVCTVFAEGVDDAACLAALKRLATRVHDGLLVPVTR